MSRVVSQRKPLCKVCQDAGKSEKEYTSHWVKDFSGNTTCPTLLKTECRYCYKVGHTTKFCKVLEKHNKDKIRSEKADKAKDKGKGKETGKSVSKNAFAALEEDDEEVELEKVEEELVLEKKVLEKALEVVPAGKSWANIAAIKPKEAEVKIVLDNKPTGLVLLSDFVEKQVKTEVNKKTEVKAVQMRSWADWSDSEDEEDLPEVNYGREIHDETW